MGDAMIRRDVAVVARRTTRAGQQSRTSLCLAGIKSTNLHAPYVEMWCILLMAILYSLLKIYINAREKIAALCELPYLKAHAEHDFLITL